MKKYIVVPVGENPFPAGQVGTWAVTLLTPEEAERMAIARAKDHPNVKFAIYEGKSIYSTGVMTKDFS